MRSSKSAKALPLKLEAYSASGALSFLSFLGLSVWFLQYLVVHADSTRRSDEHFIPWMGIRHGVGIRSRLRFPLTLPRSSTARAGK
jgi:hypothetical protein